MVKLVQIKLDISGILIGYICFLRDTAGQERFMAITKSYYRDADGIMLVYDVTNSESFDHIARWMRNVNEVIIMLTSFH